MGFDFLPQNGISGAPSLHFQKPTLSEVEGAESDAACATFLDRCVMLTFSLPPSPKHLFGLTVKELIAMYPFKFETYQDVKSNLAAATVVILFCTCLAAYYVLPPQHRNALRSLSWPSWVKGVGLLVILSVVSGILVYGIQIHDEVYDRYVVRWRQSYDLDVILKGLCTPFNGKLDSHFYEVASQNRDEFMEALFYPYVHDRDPKVLQNTLVRFYERITNYWAIQIAEIFAYLLLILAAIYFPIYRRLSLSPGRLIVLLVIFCLILGLTNSLSKMARASVRKITEQEIIQIHNGYDDTHTGYLVDLENRVRALSSKFSLKYG